MSDEVVTITLLDQVLHAFATLTSLEGMLGRLAIFLLLALIGVFLAGAGSAGARWLWLRLVPGAGLVYGCVAVLVAKYLIQVNLVDEQTMVFSWGWRPLGPSLVCYTGFALCGLLAIAGYLECKMPGRRRPRQWIGLLLIYFFSALVVLQAALVPWLLQRQLDLLFSR